MATLILLVLIFLLVLVARSTICDTIVAAAGEFGKFRVWGTENPVNGSDGTATGASSLVYDASVVSVNMPSQVTPGRSYDASITMKNTGIASWYASGNGTARLGAAGGSGGDAYRFAGAASFPLASGTVVRPGSNYTFCFNITAPLPGDYTPKFQMTGDDAGAFGETADKNITSATTATPTVSPTSTPTPVPILVPTPTPTPEPTPYNAYVATGKFIMIGKNGEQATGYIFRWCYDGPLTHHNQRSSYLNEPSWPYSDWDIGGPNGHYTIYSDYYTGSGSFDMNNGGNRGTITFHDNR